MKYNILLIVQNKHILPGKENYASPFCGTGLTSVVFEAKPCYSLVSLESGLR